MSGTSAPSQAALARFEADFARSMGTSLRRANQVARPEVISTGSLALDRALVIGGLPRGRIVEYWGPEHAGKTTLALLNIAEAQRRFPAPWMCGWVDMEQTLDTEWAQDLGVDLSRLWLVDNPQTAQDVADAHRRFVSSGLCIYSVLDSIGSMISRGSLEKEADKEARVGEVAKIVTEMVKQCSPLGAANGTTSIIINQVRAIIDGSRFGPKEGTSGGWALKHATTIKLKIRRGAEAPHTVKQDGDDVPVSVETAIRVEKNKLAPYGRRANLWIANQATKQWGPIGLDRADEAATIGVQTGAIEQRGAWYTLPDGERVNGREKVMDHLRAHPELIEGIRERMLAALSADPANNEPAGESASPGNDEVA
jgi:recombination protein RecA